MMEKKKEKELGNTREKFFFEMKHVVNTVLIIFSREVSVTRLLL